MKKQYVFLILIAIFLYISYLIMNFTLKEYERDSQIAYMQELIQEIKHKNQYANEIIEYQQSNAFRNKIIKQEMERKNKGEKVLVLTSEQKYNKYTKEVPEKKISLWEEIRKYSITENMTIYEKWMYFIFQKQS